MSAWELEREWLARDGRSPWSWRNNVLNAWAMTVLLFGGLTALFGIGVLPYLLLQAPQLPTGYAGMILLALVPPLWRRVMDPRLVAHYGGDVTRANIHPRARGRVVARYRRAVRSADPAG